MFFWQRVGWVFAVEELLENGFWLCSKKHHSQQKELDRRLEDWQRRLGSREEHLREGPQ